MIEDGMASIALPSDEPPPHFDVIWEDSVAPSERAQFVSIFKTSAPDGADGEKTCGRSRVGRSPCIMYTGGLDTG